MARPIPRRTSSIELWDAVPVATSIAWQREMLQFWSLVQTKGRRVRTPPYMYVLNPETGKNRERTVREVAVMLAARIKAESDHMPAEIMHAVEEWIAESVLVPGERKRGLVGLPVAGIAVPHMVGLGLFARGSTRERYWATTFYLWLAADQSYTDLTGRASVASAISNYLSGGLELDPANNPGVAQPYRWTIKPALLATKDPEVLLAAKALASDINDGLTSMRHGLPREYFVLAKAVLDPSKDRFSILCPGSVILLRRALNLAPQSG